MSEFRRFSDVIYGNCVSDGHARHGARVIAIPRNALFAELDFRHWPEVRRDFDDAGGSSCRFRAHAVRLVLPPRPHRYDRGRTIVVQRIPH